MTVICNMAKCIPCTVPSAEQSCLSHSPAYSNQPSTRWPGVGDIQLSRLGFDDQVKAALTTR